MFQNERPNVYLVYLLKTPNFFSKEIHTLRIHKKVGFGKKNPSVHSLRKNPTSDLPRWWLCGVWISLISLPTLAKLRCTNTVNTKIHNPAPLLKISKNGKPKTQQKPHPAHQSGQFLSPKCPKPEMFGGILGNNSCLLTSDSVAAIFSESIHPSGQIFGCFQK